MELSQGTLKEGWRPSSWSLDGAIQWGEFFEPRKNEAVLKSKELRPSAVTGRTLSDFHDLSQAAGPKRQGL
jgi:hypothetical protein